MICDKIKEVGNILSIENRISLLCPFYIKFLQDQESEVRTTACNRLAEFCVLLPVEQTASIILPNLSPLVTDVDSVKTALASVINQLCQVIGKEYTEEHLIKILIELAKDQSAEIRMCLFKDIDKLSEIVGNDALSGFVVAAIQDLSEDKQWRIKIKTVECIASLGKQLGQEFFNTHLDNIMKKLLNDSVFSVRESAINTLNDLGHLFGNIWAEKKILEEIETGKNSESYLRRMTTIFVVKSMLEFISDDQIITSIIPLIALFSSDSVSNVRLNVSKLIKEVNPLLKDTQSKDQLKSLLQLLVKDEDIDVKYYSEIALKAIT